MAETLQQVNTPKSNAITNAIGNKQSSTQTTAVPKGANVYYSPNPNWTPQDKSGVVIYIDKFGRTTGSTSTGASIPAGINVKATTTTGSNVGSEVANIVKQSTVGQNTEILNAIKNGDIQVFSGRLNTPQEIAKANLLNAVAGRSVITPEYGEYLKGLTPYGKQLLEQSNKQLPIDKLIPAYKNVTVQKATTSTEKVLDILKEELIVNPLLGGLRAETRFLTSRYSPIGVRIPENLRQQLLSRIASPEQEYNFIVNSAIAGASSIPYVGVGVRGYLGVKGVESIQQGLKAKSPEGTAQAIIGGLMVLPIASDVLKVGKGGIKSYQSYKEIPLEFRQEFTTYEKIFTILKGADIKVGNLRLERLKELPKDVETLAIIKQFIKDKELVVGGTTAIETLRVNGEVLNLRRIPRDLELYDPLKRNKKVLASELYNRLINAGKEVTLEGTTIGFKGIEGHGVNFQDFSRINIERYRNRIYKNPEGILIADPLSTAYNKVYDLLKNAKLGTKKANAILEKLGEPELIKKATAEGRIYERYPKDVVGALSTAKQVINAVLKDVENVSNRSIPLVKEYQLFKFGYAKELIKPYLKKLKYEEAPAVPFFFKGKTPTVLSGAKYVGKFYLEFERRLFNDVRAETTISKKRIKQDYYKLDRKLSPVKVKLPKIPPTYDYEAKAIANDYKYPKTALQVYNNIPSYYDLDKAIAKDYPASIYPEAQPKATPKKSTYTSKSKPIRQTPYPTEPMQVPTIILPPIMGEVPRSYPYQERKIKEPKKTLGSGYYVYGKAIRTNKYIRINNVPVTKSRAEDIGAYYVATTLARSFKVNKANRPAQEDYEFMYIPRGYYEANKRSIREFKIRKGKAREVGEIYIEKNPFLLNTRQEKKQIQDFQKQVRQILR